MTAYGSLIDTTLSYERRQHRKAAEAVGAFALFLLLAERIGYYITHYAPLPLDFLRGIGVVLAESMGSGLWYYPLAHATYFAVGFVPAGVAYAIVNRPARAVWRERRKVAAAVLYLRAILWDVAVLLPGFVSSISQAVRRKYGEWQEPVPEFGPAWYERHQTGPSWYDRWAPGAKRAA